MLKRLLAVGLLVGGAASLGLTAGPAFSQDTGVVNATVTAAAPCVIVPSTTIDYGIAAFATTNTAESYSGGAPLNVESCGVAPQGLAARGANMTSAGGAVWEPSSTFTSCLQGGVDPAQTLNRYNHQLEDYQGYPFMLTTNNSVLAVMAPGQILTYTPWLFMPCAGSDGAGQTMSTTITFTATY